MDRDLRMAGLKGFRHIYFVRCRKDFIKSLRGTTILTILFIIVYCWSDKSGYTLLNEMLSVSIKVTPPLLGFTLAGYSVILGKSTESLKDIKTRSGLTMFQKLNTTFIAMLLSTLLCLMLSVIFLVISSAEVHSWCYKFDNIMNFVAYSCLSASLSYALFAIKDLISNLFSLGQFMQFKRK